MGIIGEKASDLTDKSMLSNRWSNKEVKLLITLYRKNLPKFKEKNFRPKAIVSDISKEFTRFTENQIETKIKNLKKNPQDNIDNKSTKRGKITWPYFD
ncbi:unnamed protein product [Ceutorhynchus assimilis]|uniref:Myb/SANT-like DNA-binding domain-containing protein n=1 Tax=Ceutorhynchus assimilis TaxID=467358 RepID=A0A9N9MRV5_9CUCU|nr:unnamed protein product [Ceutorhynchus assimilis]